jgi:hypothetical protein
MIQGDDDTAASSGCCDPGVSCKPKPNNHMAMETHPTTPPTVCFVVVGRQAGMHAPVLNATTPHMRSGVLSVECCVDTHAQKRHAQPNMIVVVVVVMIDISARSPPNEGGMMLIQGQCEPHTRRPPPEKRWWSQFGVGCQPDDTHTHSQQQQQHHHLGASSLSQPASPPATDEATIPPHTQAVALWTRSRRYLRCNRASSRVRVGARGCCTTDPRQEKVARKFIDIIDEAINDALDRGMGCSQWTQHCGDGHESPCWLCCRRLVAPAAAAAAATS